MSKQDDHFFNVFSAVLGILVAITIFLFVLAKWVGGGMTAQHVADDPLLQADVAARVKAIGQVAIAGEDNSALAIAPPPGAAPAATVAVSLPANGEETYRAVCTTCHGPGIAGAPKSGDRAAWAPRIAQGMDVLYRHSIEGFQGQAGVMPARGGRADLTDELIREAVDYMVAQAR